MVMIKVFMRETDLHTCWCPSCNLPDRLQYSIDGLVGWLCPECFINKFFEVIDIGRRRKV